MRPGHTEEIVDKLADALNKALDDPATAEKLGKLGGTVPPKSERGPEYLRKTVASDIPRWAQNSEGSGRSQQAELTLKSEAPPRWQSSRRFHESRVMLEAKKSDPLSDVRERARAVARSGGLEQALAAGLPKLVECTLSEALVLGLLRQGVRKYFAIFGHGSTDLGNVLRLYEEEGATRTVNCRNEVEMAHAATALRWQYGELSAVVTSIGPGAMQAFAGSLASASNGVGVYHIYGDETTFAKATTCNRCRRKSRACLPA